MVIFAVYLICQIFIFTLTFLRIFNFASLYSEQKQMKIKMNFVLYMYATIKHCAIGKETFEHDDISRKELIRCGIPAIVTHPVYLQVSSSLESTIFHHDTPLNTSILFNLSFYLFIHTPHIIIIIHGFITFHSIYLFILPI